MSDTALSDTALFAVTLAGARGDLEYVDECVLCDVDGSSLETALDLARLALELGGVVLIEPGSHIELRDPAIWPEWPHGD